MKRKCMFPMFPFRLVCMLIVLALSVSWMEAENRYSPLPEQAKKRTILEQFKEIEREKGYAFIYSKEILPELQRTADVDVKGEIGKVLPSLFAGTSLTYQINGKQIVVKRAASGNLLKLKQKQEKTKRTLTGLVSDGDLNEPLVGAAVKVKGTDTGVITDINGHYSIQVTNDTQLEFSYLGYATQTLAVNDLGVLNVTMKSDNETIDEVVIVGAGTQKKVSVTGAIATMRGSDMRLPSPSLTSNLTGKLAGVISIASSGEPGATSQFYIRGISTFGGRSTPLILLDGVEISIGDLDRLPAESIESFSILKDASATAIYGARGANGVMLVTTKQGHENTKAEIRVSFENSFYKPVNQVKFADGVTYMELYNEAEQSRYPGNPQNYTDDVIRYTREGVNPYIYPNTDWVDLVFKKHNMNQRINANVSGGGSRATYYLGLQANHTTGLINVPKQAPISTNYNRWEYVFQNNISYKVTDATKVDLRINAQIGRLKGPDSNAQSVLNMIELINPVIFPPYYPAQEGDDHIRFGNITSSSPKSNPYAVVSQTLRQQNYSTINAILNLDQKLDFLTEGLSLSAMVNFKAWANSSSRKGFKPYYYEPVPGLWDESNPGVYELQMVGSPGDKYIWEDSSPTRETDNTFYFDGRINYRRVFGNHTVSGMLMYMMREYFNAVLPYRNQGFSGRFTYDYFNKYLVEFNFGYNGTERLAKGERFEFFPAVSLGWVASNEPFWEPISNVVDYLKLRTSYGLVGSDESGSGAGRFLYLQDVDMNGYNFTTGYEKFSTYNGPKIKSMRVENAHWERSKKFNVGIDATLLNQVNLTLEYFHEKRDRILVKRGTFPWMAGYGESITPWSNMGKTTYEGFEASVNWNKQLTRDLAVDFRGSFTYNRTILNEKDEPNYPYVWRTAKNKPLQSTMGYVSLGLFESDEEVANSPDQSYLGGRVQAGDIKYQDVNGDGVINDNDQVMISPYGSIPRMQFGLGMNIVYKKWDIGVFFNGTAQRTILMTSGGDVPVDIFPFTTPQSQTFSQLLQFVADDHWSLENPNPAAKFPRLGIVYGDYKNNHQPSTYWKRNGNYFRFKTFELGYTFPNVRVYFSGDNLAVWSPFKHWDPALWWNQYPMSRTFNIGAQVKF